MRPKSGVKYEEKQQEPEGTKETANGDTLTHAPEFTLIPFYNVEASAGGGSVIHSEEQISQVAFRKDWIKNKGLQEKYLAAIKAKGDSMEPTLYDGDMLLVDTNIKEVKDDSIYIIQTDNNLVVKRLQQAINGAIYIISDNLRYQQQKIEPYDAETLKIAGRVIWYGHEI